ncbi:MAG: hypothetical protein K6D97_07300 [Clostridia bacterium]|nr:hypothetical protein [Clostridia bacterium]
MDQNAQAIFQLQDSYVNEYTLTILKKIESKEDIVVTGQLGFGIESISENDETYSGQIVLINDLSISIKDEEYAKIHISMRGLFYGVKNSENSLENFEKMLKINGATALSHLIRAYVYTNTGLSGIPQISTPMINFVKFFEDAEKDNKK